MASGQLQGTEGFKRGNLKRQLESIPIALFSSAIPGNAEAGSITQRIWLTGLNGNLKVIVACGMQSEKFSSTPFPWPSGGGTLQLYPVTKFGDALKIFLRPVFQNPASVTNVNAPLPQELPYGWEGPFTEVDQVMIEVVIQAGQWVGLNLNGTLTVQVAVEYNGAWWDIDAIEYVMGQVQLNGAVQYPTIGTGA